MSQTFNFMTQPDSSEYIFIQFLTKGPQEVFSTSAELWNIIDH